MKKFLHLCTAVILLLSACKKDETKGEEQLPPETYTEPKPFNELPASEAGFQLEENDDHVNVSGTDIPQVPGFRALAIKPGYVRGYVKNSFGKPLAGAYIGIRSSAIGGAYTLAFTQTDERGFYEMEAPFGAAHFYAAGYELPYGGATAAVGLHPADGQSGSFSASDGTVENFVALPYGRANTQDIATRPWYARNYYGGTIRISYSTAVPNDPWATPGSIPEGKVIELKLTPFEFLWDAREKKSFVIRKKTGNLNFNITNIPIGKYLIEARLTDGTILKLKAGNFTPHPVFGLKPNEALGEATVLFMPHGTVAREGAPSIGGWTETSIKLEKP